MNSTDFILNGSKEYSLYVAQQRAIPHITDGLKAGQRIALWLLRNRSEKIKTIGLVGELAASGLYVHGDSSSSNAIGLLAAPYKNNICLIEGIGSFGSRTKPVDGIGSPRYTSIKRSKAAQAYLYNDLPLVPLEDNYDGSNKQPSHFLPLIPIVLLNGVIGVAVGFSTEILPHSLKSITDATKAILQGKKAKELEPYYENYNLGIKSLGNNQWELSGKVTILNGSTLKITELPPAMALEKFKKTLIQMEDDDRISNFIDRSSDKIDIEVRFKRNEIKDWTEDTALDFFKLREKTTERIVVVDFDSKGIKTYDSTVKLIQDFVEWRLGWYENRYRKLLVDTQYELVYWRLLSALFKNGFTKKLGKFSNKKAIEDDIQQIANKVKLDVTDEHISKAVSLPTYRWTQEFEAEVDSKIKELELTIADYEDILSKPERRKAIYLDEVSGIKI